MCTNTDVACRTHRNTETSARYEVGMTRRLYNFKMSRDCGCRVLWWSNAEINVGNCLLPIFHDVATAQSLQTSMLFRSLIQPDLPRSEHDPDPTREDSQIATAVEATVSEATARAIRDLSRPIAHVHVDLEAPPTVTPIVIMPIVTPIVVIHPPVTGACTDPSHEPASRAQLFRLAFPAHVMLLALLLTLSTTWILLTPNMASGVRALCMALVAMGCVVLVVGSVSHLARLMQDEEKRRLVQEKQRLAEEKLRLEERNEQLQAEKERLLYDMQHRGPPDEEDRSAIRRGLRAGSHPSEAGGPAPSDSPPPSLPPGAPSSAATGESASGSFRSSSRAPDEPEEAEATSCLPSWHPPLRQQRVTAPLPSAAAEASSGQKRASLGQVLVNEALAEMAMEEEEASRAAVCTPPPPYPPLLHSGLHGLYAHTNTLYYTDHLRGGGCGADAASYHLPGQPRNGDPRDHPAEPPAAEV